MSRGRTCARHGCERPISRKRSESDYCCYLCQLVVSECESAQRITAAVGDGEHYANAVQLNDALTAYVKSQTRVYRCARDGGMDDRRWQSIRDGHGR